MQARGDTYRWHSLGCRVSSSLLRAQTVSSCSVQLKTSRSRWHCRVLHWKDKGKFSLLSGREESHFAFSSSLKLFHYSKVSEMRLIKNAKCPWTEKIAETHSEQNCKRQKVGLESLVVPGVTCVTLLCPLQTE